MSELEGNFESALLQLIQSLRYASQPSNGADREVWLFASKILREWDATRGQDWFTKTRKGENE